MINNFRLFTSKYFSVDVDIENNTIQRLILVDSNDNFISDWEYFDDDMRIDDYMRLIVKMDAMPSDELANAIADEFDYEAIINPTITEAVEIGREYGDDYLNIIDNHFVIYNG